MSQYSSLVNRFIINSLLPEIDSLNMSLASMEEFGYNSTPINLVNEKLSKLLPVYDFLIEYAEGNEECEFGIIEKLMNITGLSIMSDDTAQPIINSPVSNNTTSILSYQDASYIRILIDGKLFDGSTITADEHTITFTSEVDVDSITINGSNHIGSTFSYVNTLLSAGNHEYNIILIKDGESVFNKTIIIESV